MTYTDYITKTLAKFDISIDDVSLIILNEGLVATDTVDIVKAKTAMYNQMSVIIPIYEVSESGFSKKINTEGLKIWYASVSRELNMPDLLGLTVKNISNRW
jgi:hypothetical protein